MITPEHACRAEATIAHMLTIIDNAWMHPETREAAVRAARLQLNVLHQFVDAQKPADEHATFERSVDVTAIQDTTPTYTLPHRDPNTLILMDLTADDVQRFHAAKLPYSGQAHNDRYIATFPDALAPALNAMDWRLVSIEYRSGTYTVRRTPPFADRFANTVSAALSDYYAALNDACGNGKR